MDITKERRGLNGGVTPEGTPYTIRCVKGLPCAEPEGEGFIRIPASELRQGDRVWSVMGWWCEPISDTPRRFRGKVKFRNEYIHTLPPEWVVPVLRG